MTKKNHCNIKNDVNANIRYKLKSFNMWQYKLSLKQMYKLRSRKNIFGF